MTRSVLQNCRDSCSNLNKKQATQELLSKHKKQPRSCTFDYMLTFPARTNESLQPRWLRLIETMTKNSNDKICPLSSQPVPAYFTCHAAKRFISFPCGLGVIVRISVWAFQIFHPVSHIRINTYLIVSSSVSSMRFHGERVWEITAK